ncbi:MAG TPA: trehalose-6-phosphate synthase [Verrucomicrobiae bacterium]|nr:trehalose-6-phosphate synthase [Verrucomicrobiae bacterium]
MRLVAVSNRVDSPRGAPSAGGLAVALVDALCDHRGLWFGWSGKITMAGSTAPQIEEADGFTVATLDLPRDEYDLYYNGFANHCLWPLVHFRVDIAAYVRAEYQSYLRINQRFAEALVPLLQPDDLIWIHDYHLFALPTELRRRGVRQRIGFFLHTPFPPRDILVALPRHAELMRALFDCELLGLQTPADVERFADYACHELGAERTDDGLRAFGRKLRVEAFPVGIDAERFQAFAVAATGEREWGRLREALRGRAQIIGVDRLDYSKGLSRRLSAFEQLLRQHPETRGAVEYLQFAPISRGDVKAYRDFRRELEQKAARINGTYAQVDWTPVRYLNRSLPRQTLAGFHRASRIGLVTPMRDGMNLVAKEYVAAQDPEDPGVLVLSQFAGAARQMPAALLVNPYDVEDVANALHRALNMGRAERVERHRILLDSVTREDITSWRRDYVRALQQSDPADARVSRQHDKKTLQQHQLGRKPPMLSRQSDTSVIDPSFNNAP